MLHRFVLLLVGVTTALVLCAPVFAETPRSPDELKRLSDQALAKARKGDLDGAIETWLDVLDEVAEAARPDIHANLAVAYNMAGKPAEAWHHLTTYLRTCGREDKAAGKELQKLEERLAVAYGKVGISCAPADATIYLEVETTGTDGRPTGKGTAYACPLTWWLLGGDHQVLVTKEGYEPQVLKVTAAVRGGVGAYAAQLVRRKAPVVPPVDRTVQPVPERGPIPGTGIAKVAEVDREFPVWQTTLMAGGAALLVAGGIMNFLAYDANQDLADKYPEKELNYTAWLENRQQYKDEFADSVKPKRTAAYLLYGLGGAAAAAGAIWLVVDQAGATPDDADGGLTLGPLDPALGIGFSLGMGF